MSRRLARNVIVHDSGRHLHLVAGAEVPAHLAHRVPESCLVPLEPPAADAQESVADSWASHAPGTVDAVLAWVGDDPERAAHALEVERAGSMRVTLIAALTAIVGE